MYLLKFETKIVEFDQLVSLGRFNSLQISIKAKLLNSKKIPEEKLKSWLRKKHLFTRNFDRLSVTWPNFIVAKYNLKIFNVYHHIKFPKSIMNRCFIKKRFLKILQYSQENIWFGVSFLMKIQVFIPVNLLKRSSNTGFFLRILLNF